VDGTILPVRISDSAFDQKLNFCPLRYLTVHLIKTKLYVTSIQRRKSRRREIQKKEREVAHLDLRKIVVSSGSLHNDGLESGR